MLVIEGKSNKSRMVEKWIRKEYMGDRLAIIDNQGVDALGLIENIDHLKTSVAVTTIISECRRECNNYYSKYDWLVFYVNSSTDDISLFQELDRDVPQNIVVTIQKNDQSLTNKYFL